MHATSQFKYSSTYPVPIEAVWRFHENPAAFQLLVPPPMRAVIFEDRRTSLTEGEIDFSLKLGPIEIPWKAAHEPGPTPYSFVDRQINGPVKFWRHLHQMDVVPGGTQLTDQIEIEYPDGWRGLLARLLYGRISLAFLFHYRHWRTGKALQDQQTANKIEV